jgi:hypothetical protein
MYFAEKFFLGGTQVDNPVGNHHVKGPVAKGNAFVADLEDHDIGGPGLRQVPPCSGSHFLGQINAVDPALRPGKKTGNEQIEAGAAADVQDDAAASDGLDGKRIADPAERAQQFCWALADYGRIVPQGLGPFPTGGILKFSCGRKGDRGIFPSDRPPDLFQRLRG